MFPCNFTDTESGKHALGVEWTAKWNQQGQLSVTWSKVHYDTMHLATLDPFSIQSVVLIVYPLELRQ